jgi:hypothetical protein
MGMPAGYVAWCLEHALNAWHPDEWPPEGHRAYQAWKRDVAAGRHARRVDDGTFALMSFERQLELLEEEEKWAEEPPPSRPFRYCPCHMFAGGFTGAGQGGDTRLPHERITPEATAAWVAADPLWRAGLTPATAGALAWLEQTFAQRIEGITKGARPTAGHR